MVEIHEINESGYAGVLPNGNIVSRLEYPEAYPVQKSSAFGIPKPKKIKEEITSDYVCFNCGSYFLTQEQTKTENFFTFHEGQCGVCGANKSIAHIRNYNYLNHFKYKPKKTIKMIVNQTIYKKDSSGKVRYLTISAEGSTVVQTSGVVGTSNPVQNISQCEAKNVGKANATTPEEQAVLEAKSKLDEKIRLGYFYTIEEAQRLGGSNFLLPMLAKDYKKEAKKVKFPCYVQPKLDGMRSLYDGGFISRTGKAIDTLGHIVLPDTQGFVIDGELYAHGISFQENMKLIKKYRKGETEQVKYHVYDLVSDLPFSERTSILLGLFQDSTEVEVVPTYIINNEEELIKCHEEFINQGYEGTMIRHSEEGYQVNKRSSQLLKYKDFLDKTYVVVDVIPSESRPEQGIVVCLLDNMMGPRITFNCGMKFSHDAREEILRNKHMYIGQIAEVRFFEFTDGGLPRFPICVGFRSTFEK